MAVLIVGKTEIPYHICYSSKAKSKRIIITPGRVEVVVPNGTDSGVVAAFMVERRRWVFEKRYEIESKAARIDDNSPGRFASGVKIPYRGRQMRLLVRRGGVEEVQVVYRNGFEVRVPECLAPDEREEAVSETLVKWLKDRMTRDVHVFVAKYSKRLGLIPKAVRIKEQKHLWGSCGRDGIINLNWHLIFAPKSVLEYAVVHELCHLEHRNHSPEFWGLVAGQVADYELKKQWLEQNDGVLSPSFLLQAADQERK